MHLEVLNNRQVELLPAMSSFRKEYYLVGGTAIALYLGHRRSIDFDLFKPTAINHKKNLDRLTDAGFSYTVTHRVAEQMNLMVNNVKVTFFEYPFPVEPTVRLNNTFRLPPLIQLAAMKAFALGRRSKWKDYVDLYFLLKDHFTLNDIALCANSLFGELFSEKMFRAQLCYYEDVDYSEEVDYLIDDPPSSHEVASFLCTQSKDGL